MREVAQDGRSPELSVMAWGCLGLVFLTPQPGRLALERIERLYPELVPALRDHPGIGFMLVRSERHGAVTIGAHGTHYLDENRVEGEDPLASFGPNAARHVRRADGFEHVADVMVDGTFFRVDAEGARLRGPRRLSRRHGWLPVVPVRRLARGLAPARASYSRARRRPPAHAPLARRPRSRAILPGSHRLRRGRGEQGICGPRALGTHNLARPQHGSGRVRPARGS